MSKFRDTVTLLRAPVVTNPYGNSGRDWSLATATTVPANVQGPSGQGLSGSEDVTDENRVTTRWRLYLPGGADLEATDRVRFGGDVYEVDGQVLARRERHVRALLLRVEQEVG